MSHHWVLLGFGVLQACQPAAPAPSVLSPTGSAAALTPGAAPAEARQPAKPVPFVMDVWATTHGSVEGPFRNDVVLVSGDRIDLKARTSLKSDLYLLYCDQHLNLALLPKSGSIPMLAQQTTSLPSEGQQFRLDNTPGREVLYIVSSQRPLAQADPLLHHLITKARSSRECDQSFEEVLTGALASEQPFAKPAASEAPTRDVAKPSKPPRATTHQALPKPVEIRLRGLEVVESTDHVISTEAGADGVVVVRLSFSHR